jgi:hypothetical protein
MKTIISLKLHSLKLHSCTDSKNVLLKQFYFLFSLFLRYGFFSASKDTTTINKLDEI